MVHLIANSGIHFVTKELEFNPSMELILPNGKPLKYTFLECVNQNTSIFDFLCYHSQAKVYIPLNELRESGQYEMRLDGRENLDIYGLTQIASGVGAAQFSNYSSGQPGVYSINSLNGYTIVNSATNERTSAFEMLLGKWLPMPMFEVMDDGFTMDYPLAWCRLKIERIGTQQNEKGIERFRLIWAFDTELSNDDLSNLRPQFYEGENNNKKYSLCNCAYEMFHFLSIKNEGDEFSAFSEYIYELLGCPNNPINPYKYLAYYIYLINFLRLSNAAPSITLHHNTDLSDLQVDLVLDIGNSRTCGVLFENGDFTKAQLLKLRDLTHPNRVYDKSFDMRFVFRQADFGNDIVLSENVFKWYSFVRVGDEAKHLVYRSLEQDGLAALATNYSSPKRYLWDNKPFDGHWENLIKEDDSFTVKETKNIYIPKLSEMFDSNGNYIPEGGEGGYDIFAETNYSRSSLMTFVLIEIFQQAMSQINSPEFRTHHGDKNRRRVLRNIILTCPTAMPQTEQIKLRKCAEDAYDALRRSIPRLNAANIIPSSNDLKGLDGTPTVWSYDEASCCQLTYLYAEIAQRYQGSIYNFFNLKGHIRQEDAQNGYNEKTLTIGSVDIGAGTTDVMICSYRCQGKNAARLTPIPLYWDSFYLAGDDILRNLVQDLILEGQESSSTNMGNIRSVLLARIMCMSDEDLLQIPCVRANHVYEDMVNNIQMAIDDESKKQLKRTFVNNLMHDFFGNDSAGMSHKARRCRLDFNTQISVPIAQKYLELLRLKRPTKVYSFEELFDDNKPASYLLDYFEEHFGFRFEELSWRFDPIDVANVVKTTLEPLMKQLAKVLYAHQCDRIVLAGRPTSLDAITELFVKYLPAYPNKLVRLNEYRIGKFFPTATGEGYFYDQKAIVAVGAMVGNLAMTVGLPGFALNFKQMIDRMKSTARYIGEYDIHSRLIRKSVLTPSKMTTTLEVPVFPIFLGCKQFDALGCQARPLYALYSNERSLRIILSRDYQDDRETLKIDEVMNEQGESLSMDTVELVQQSLVDDGKHWLDKGTFTLTIN